MNDGYGWPEIVYSGPLADITGIRRLVRSFQAFPFSNVKKRQLCHDE
jgi:hypothetical protein